MTKKTVATAKPDGRKEKGRKVREQILYATLELAGEKGSGALTAPNLAERVGVSKANLYHHFRNMQEIRIEACMHYLELLKPVAYDAEYDDARKFLVDLQAGVADFLRKNQTLDVGYGIIFSNEVRTNPKFIKLIEKKVLGRKDHVKRKIRAIMGLSEEDAVSERILLGLDMMREGVNTYILNGLDKGLCLGAWNAVVDIMLERLEKR